MTNVQKLGGVAALIEAATFIVGFGLFATILAPASGTDLDPIQKVAFVVANRAILALANMIIYVLFGIVLVGLALALHARLEVAAPAHSQLATAFGLLWAGLVIASGMIATIGARVVSDLAGTNTAQAAVVWTSIAAVVEGLGGGNEIVGGVWVLLVSWAGLRTGVLPKALNGLGIVISGAGILTILPVLGALGGATFGLGLIVWFVWLGIVLLRRRTSTAV